MSQYAGDEAGTGGVLALGVLGPLEVWLDGQLVELTAGRLRTLLAVLALSAGRAVSVDRLAAALWDDRPPPRDARRSAQTYLTRLRSVLGGGLLPAGNGGYLLQVEPDRVDALRFIRLLDDAAGASDRRCQRMLLQQGLSLWRGTPFEGLSSAWLRQSEAPRLRERYLAAIEQRIDLDLAEGRREEPVVQLYELTGQHRLRESLWVRLLTALDRAGRRAEALQQYETVRRELAEQLGTDPGPQLQQAYADLLAGRALQPPQRGGSGSPDSGQPVSAPGGPDPAEPSLAPQQQVLPQQLPADIGGFAGRDAALKALHERAAGTDPPAGPVVISAIAGTAGVGKTALAVHWAHQVADRFPDGQLYVNLRGFDPTGQVMDPADAIRGFLEALQVPPQRIPPDPQAQAGLYRSLLAGRRMLVLLDNARDADQVRPLLPGCPGCLVVVTSRNQLTSLVATDAAHPLMLDLLPVDEARAMLAHRIGPDRTAAEPAAVDEIITHCAGLPLALAILAAHAASRPTFPLETLAQQLRGTRSRLDTLSAGDPATDARTVFSWSYQELSTAAAQLFRLLGLHPGPDIAAPAAASLTGRPVPQIRPLLAELTNAHLVVEHLPGRYTLHDLLRAYATELAHTHDTEAGHSAARHRMFDHYLHTAYTAAMLLDPHRHTVTLPPPEPGSAAQDLADHDHALAWFTAEHAVLLAAIEQAADTGADAHAWQLARTLWDALDRRGYWREWSTALRTALHAARRLDDNAAIAHTHRGLAAAYTKLGRYEDAQPHLRDALDLFTRLGEAAEQGRAHHNLSFVLTRQGRHPEALQHSRRALDLFRASGDRSGEAIVLNALGWRTAQLGNYHQALASCQKALAINQEVGNRLGEAATWDSLGYAYHHLGQHQEAIECFRRSVELCRGLGNRYDQTHPLIHLGDTHLATGELEAARAAWLLALSILEDLDHPEAAHTRTKLAQLDDSPG